MKRQGRTIADCVFVVLKETGWITTENIFTAPQRKGKTLPMLAEVLRADLPLQLEEKNSISSIVSARRVARYLEI